MPKHLIHLTLVADLTKPSQAAHLLASCEEFGDVTSFTVSKEEPRDLWRSAAIEGVVGGATSGGVANAQQSQAPVEAAAQPAAEQTASAPARRGRPPKAAAAEPAAEPAPAPQPPAVAAADTTSAPSGTTSAASSSTSASSEPAQEASSGNGQRSAGSAEPSTTSNGAPPAATDAPVTVADIRKVLTPKAQGGKRTEVNQLIQKYGRTLDQVPAEKLPELYAEAQAL